LVVYTDLFWLSLTPIVMQAFALSYLWRVRNFLGYGNTALMSGLNWTMISYSTLMLYLIFHAGNRAGTQTIEAYGVFIAFVFPIMEATLMLLLERKLAHGFIVKPKKPKRGRFSSGSSQPVNPSPPPS
jgi:hypothetical protein